MSLNADIVEDFDRVVGLSYLRGMHLNDSKGGLGSKKDRHENIGLYVTRDPCVAVPRLTLHSPAQRRTLHHDLCPHPHGPTDPRHPFDPRDTCIRWARFGAYGGHGSVEEGSGGTAWNCRVG